MRVLIKVAVVLAVLWSGWWVIASMSLRTSLSTWLQARAAEGWQAESDGISVQGYPFDLNAQITSPALADPVTGVAVSASLLRLQAPVWWPGYTTVHLPDDGILLAGPDAQAVLTTAEGKADLRLRPGSALEVEQLALTSGPWGMVSGDQTLLSAQDFRLEMFQNGDQRTAYEMTLEAADLSPGDALRAAWSVPTRWPVRFDSFIARMDVEFDRPWDRGALETARPQPRQIDLHLAEMAWGDLLFRVTADLDVNAAGLATGSLSLQAQNWRAILDVAQSSGRLPAGLRQQVETVLAALSGSSGNPDSLDVDLQLEDSIVRLGFLPLAKVPPFILR